MLRGVDKRANAMECNITCDYAATIPALGVQGTHGGVGAPVSNSDGSNGESPPKRPQSNSLCTGDDSRELPMALATTCSGLMGGGLVSFLPPVADLGPHGGARLGSL